MTTTDRESITYHELELLVAEVLPERAALSTLGGVGGAESLPAFDNALAFAIQPRCGGPELPCGVQDVIT